MSRYFVRPRADKPLYVETPLWSEDKESFRPNLDVPDHDATFTGLLDAAGEEIWRAPNPMGFVWRD